MSLFGRLEEWWSRRRGTLGDGEINLSRLPLDLEAEVTRIELSDPARIHRLASLGILPGARLRLVQNRGAYLAVVDRYQVAFDAAVARSVWVRRPPASSES